MLLYNEFFFFYNVSPISYKKGNCMLSIVILLLIIGVATGGLYNKIEYGKWTLFHYEPNWESHAMVELLSVVRAFLPLIYMSLLLLLIILILVSYIFQGF